MAWDTDRPYHYLRWTDDGRLLFGGEDTRHRSSKGSRRRIARARERLTAYLARIYPELADESPEYAWEGLFAETPDGLPYIGEHSRYPGHLFALGYGGNGMTASFLAASDAGGFVSAGATSLVKRGRSPICLPLTAARR